jgi:hypothetical protein
MIIVEASERNNRQVMDCMEHLRRSALYTVDARIYTEESGNMMILELDYSTIQDTVNLQATAPYRRFLGAIQTFVIGNPVHKIFQLKTFEAITK